MKKPTYYLLFFSILLAAAQCEKDQPVDQEQAEEMLRISHQVPGDLTVLNPSTQDLAKFAWNEFFALNWQSSFKKNNLRVTPDTTWAPNQSTYQPDLTVWETFIHKNELAPVSGYPLPSLKSGRPTYGYGFAPFDPQYGKQYTAIDTNGIAWNNYWNNLDEDNEINSCILFDVESPDSISEEVLYMAKTNLIEYNYLRDHFKDTLSFYNAIQHTAMNEAALKAITTNNGTCDPDSGQVAICLPCGNESQEGAIEIKTAWRKLKSGDNPNHFISRTAIYYTLAPKPTNSKKEVIGSYKVDTATFVLIGMHIIHKTEKFPAFVFASFEHVGVKNSNYQFIGSDAPFVNGKADTLTDADHFQPVIPRNIPAAVDSVNNLAHKAIRATNVNSVWQNYQLIGVQATPINYVDRNLDPNYFMANYVIESDSLLTFFHGSFDDPFNETITNVRFMGESFNMGGCQGCHGRAQYFGTDFSFIVGYEPTEQPDYYMTYAQAIDSAKARQIQAYVQDTTQQKKKSTALQFLRYSTQ